MGGFLVVVHYTERGNDTSYPMHMFLRGQLAGGSGNSRRAKMSGEIKVEQFADAEQFILFETRPKDNPEADFFYEIGDTYEIIEGMHMGNLQLSNALDQNQTISQPAIIHSRFFNCYSFGNGVESYKYQDSFNVNSLKMNLRPNLVDPNGYKVLPWVIT